MEWRGARPTGRYNLMKGPLVSLLFTERERAEQMTRPDLMQPVNLILSQPSRVSARQRACVCPAVYIQSL